MFAIAAALPPALAQLQTLVDREQRLNKAKEAMAMAANALLSGPEDHVGELRTLTALLGDADMQVCVMCVCVCVCFEYYMITMYDFLFIVFLTKCHRFPGL